MKKLSFLIIPLLALLLGTGCHSHADGDNHSHSDSAMGRDDHPEDDFMVGLSAAQMKSIGLELGRLEHKSLTNSIRANGFLKVPNQNKATVTSLYGGVISSIKVMPGNLIGKGEVAVVISNPRWIPMQEEFLSLSPKIELAEVELKRQQELKAGQAGALKNLQTAEAELKTLQIRRSSLETQLQLMGISTSDLSADRLVSQIPVRSPISGSVDEVLVNIGSSVDAATPIIEVVDNNSLHLDLFVYEKDLPHVHVGQTIHFILTNQPGKSYTAEIFGIGAGFENESKAIAIHAIVKDRKQGLFEGMSVTAQINVENSLAAALPNEAFVNHNGVDYVFIKRAGAPAGQSGDDDSGRKEGEAHPGSMSEAAHESETIFEKIPVKRGVSELGYTEVVLLKEVPETAQFATKGAFFLMAKMTNAGEAHEH